MSMTLPFSKRLSSLALLGVILAVPLSLTQAWAEDSVPEKKPRRHEVTISGSVPAEAEMSLEVVYESYTRTSPTLTDEGWKHYPTTQDVEIPVKRDGNRGTFSVNFKTHKTGLILGKANLAEARIILKTKTHQVDTFRIYQTDETENPSNGLKYGRLTDVKNLVATRTDAFGSKYLSIAAEFGDASAGASNRMATFPTTDGKTEARFDIILK